MQKILIIGGTGMIGKPVTRALIGAGFPVTLLARDPKKTAALFPQATVKKGDVFDPISLMLAMEGQDAVYISISPPRSARPIDRMPEREGMENIIATAQRSGIRRIVLLSSLVQYYNNTNDFHWWVFDIKQAAVEQLKQCGIAYTIFYPSTFMESLDQLLLRGNRILLLGHSQVPMYFIAAADYAQQVVRAFKSETTENKEYAVQGPEGLTWQQAAQVFSRYYTRKKIHVHTLPLSLFKVMGSVIPFINTAAKISAALNHFPERFESDLTWRDLGEPKTTVATYAAGL